MASHRPEVESRHYLITPATLPPQPHVPRRLVEDIEPHLPRYDKKLQGFIFGTPFNVSYSCTVLVLLGTISGIRSCVREIPLSRYLLPRGVGEDDEAQRGADTGEQRRDFHLLPFYL